MENIVVGDPDCTFLTVRDTIMGSDSYLVTNSRWIDLARELQIKDETIEQLRRRWERGEITLNEVVYQVLVTWRGLSGRNSTLSSLVTGLENNGGIGVADELRKIFEQGSNNAIHHQEYIERFKDTIPPKISYYITRKLVPRNMISNNVFKNDENDHDVFLVSGMDRSQLTSLASNRTDIARKQIKQREINVRFLILEFDSDFEDICNITERPVHWLHSDKNGVCTWVKSHGKIKTIQKNIIEKTQVSMSEDEFLQNLESDSRFRKSSTPVLISDSPGMGKSLVLGSIGIKLKEIYPDRIVMFVVIGELYSNLTNNNSNNNNLETEHLTPDVLLDVLSFKIIQNDIKRKTFVGGIKAGNLHLELLVDGFDEVELKEQERAAQRLRLISKTFINIRLWVTTRPHLLEKLENTLDTIAYKLQAFDEQDQMNFLISFWSRDNKELDTSRLEQFANTCLKNLQSQMKDKERRIAGFPLQCLLIGELFQEDAEKYGDPENKLYSDTISPYICIKPLTDLYMHMIEKKIFEYMEKYPDSNILREQIIDTHVYLSLLLLFPQSAEKLRKYLYSDLMSNDKVLKLGVLESTAGNQFTPRFIHRTFAEYFVALFVLDCLKKQGLNEDVTQFLFDFLMHTTKTTNSYQVDEYFFEHEVICFFIDSLLNLDVKGLRLNIPKQFDEAYKICHACASGDFINMFKLFDNLKLFEGHEKEIFNEQLVFISSSYSGIELLSIICGYFTTHHGFAVTDIRKHRRSVLHEAVNRGDYSIVEYLLQVHGFDKVVEKGELKQLLHECVTRTNWQDDKTINEKIGIIRLLCGINGRLVDELNQEGESPIICEDVHVRIIKELMNLGANILAVDKYKNTLLHKLGDRCQDCQNIMTVIPMQSLKKLVNMKRYDGYTPLHELVRLSDPDENTFKLFKQAGADLNSVNLFGETILVTAIEKGRSLDCVKNLISFGASLEFNNESIIHSAIAAKQCSIPVLEYLIKEKGFDVNLKDSGGNTPLHYAVRNNALKAVKYLVEECKADLNVCNENGLTPLLHAIKHEYSIPDIRMLEYFESNGWLDTPELLEVALRMVVIDKIEKQFYKEFLNRMVMKGANILDVIDEEHNTLLHYAAGRNHSEGVRYYVTKRLLDVNARNKRNETPLHYALRYKYPSIEVVKALVTLGADLFARDDNKNTPMHAALKNNYDVKILQYLESTGVYENMFQTSYSLYFSAKHSQNDKIFEFVCEKYTEMTGERILDIGGNCKYKSLLHAAVLNTSGGIDTIVRYLVNEQLFDTCLHEDLIHACVENTAGKTSILDSKINAIKFLVENNPKLLIGKDEQRRLPVQVENVHNELKDLLIELYECYG